MSVNKSMARSAGVVGLSTLMSRILGLVRDIVMSTFFGTGPVADAFYVAFQIPNLMRRMVGEGSLTVAFISVFTKLKNEEGDEVARRFMSSFWTLMTIVLAGLTVLGMVFSRQIVYVFTNPEFRADPVKFQLAVTMTREMFPYLFLIGLVALSMGILNSYKHFFAPAFSPVLLNVAWIISVLALHYRFPQQGLSIILGVLAGGVLQLAMQIPFLWRYGMRFMPRFNFRHPAIRRIGVLMIPSTFAVGIVQINSLFASYFITAFAGGRSQFYYANRLAEFPYAIFSLAVAIAVLPTLSDQAGEQDRKAFKETLSYGLRLVTFITVPAAVGLALLSWPIINTIFEHGKFGPFDTYHTAFMLVMFCVGLWAVAALRMVMQAYYAVEDMVTPLWSAAVAMVVNIAGCWLLSRTMGRAGVPFAISLAAMVNLLILWVRLEWRIGRFEFGPLGRTLLVSLIASLPMAAIIMPLNNLDFWFAPGRIIYKALLVAGEVGAGIMLFALVSWLFKAPELSMISDAFMRRLKRKK